MQNSEIANGIRRVLTNELDDCERALKKGDTKKALRELDDAMTKLKQLANQLR